MPHGDVIRVVHRAVNRIPNYSHRSPFGVEVVVHLPPRLVVRYGMADEETNHREPPAYWTRGMLTASLDVATGRCRQACVVKPREQSVATAHRSRWLRRRLASAALRCRETGVGRAGAAILERRPNGNVDRNALPQNRRLLTRAVLSPNLSLAREDVPE